MITQELGLKPIPLRKLKKLLLEAKPVALESPTGLDRAPSVGLSGRGYTEKGLLGRGQFGTTYLVEKAGEDQPFAEKRLVCSNLDEANKAIDEAQAMKQGSPHLVTIHDTWLSKGDYGSFIAHIVMEYCDGGDLGGYMKTSKLEEADAKLLLTGVVAALAHLHNLKKPIAHLDVKPANILLHNGETGLVAKLADFGMAKQIRANAMTQSTRGGTPLYMAPEVASGRRYETSADIWSLGVVMAEMAGATRNHVEAFHTRRASDPSNTVEHVAALLKGMGFSDGWKELTGMALTMNPLRRPSALDMVNSALESGQLLQSCITVVCPELYQESGQLIQNAVDAQPWMALRHSKTQRLPWNAMPEIAGMKRAEFAPSEHPEEYNTLCAMLEGSGLLREFDIERVVLCHDRARANKLFSQRKDLLHKLDFKANSHAFASRMLSGTEEDRNFRKTVLAEFTQRFEDKKHKKHCSLETDGGAGVALAFHAPSSAKNAELILQGEPAHTCLSALVMF